MNSNNDLTEVFFNFLESSDLQLSISLTEKLIKWFQNGFYPTTNWRKLKSELDGNNKKNLITIRISFLNNT